MFASPFWAGFAELFAGCDRLDALDGNHVVELAYIIVEPLIAANCFQANINRRAHAKEFVLVCDTQLRRQGWIKQHPGN